MTLKYDYVRDIFKEEGYTLLSSTYKNLDTKLDFTCPNGHNHSITLRHFKRGIRCGRCNGNIKITYEEVREAFEKRNYTLLSKKYKNCNSKLDYICNAGHTHSISWSSFNQGHGCPECYHINNSSKRNNFWKGGVISLDIPLYSTFGDKLSLCNSVLPIKKDKLVVLGVTCVYCGKTYTPRLSEVIRRVAAVNGSAKGEQNFYCSHNCKKACPTFGQRLYPKGFKLATSREVQPGLRKLVLKRDNYRCQKCDKGPEEVQLHCHHIDPVINNPIESADLDNCITLCKNCHKEVHKLPNCTYYELKC